MRPAPSRLALSVLVLLAIGPAGGRALAIPAFPGAQGFGSETPGGRGGAVVEVTNLNDTGPGSLRRALEGTTGPRTVVFRVGGTIELQRAIELQESNSYVTVAGHTAPGGGIALKNYGLVLRDGVHDVVIRFLRVRPGTANPAGIPGSSIDGISLVGNGSHVHDVVIDHCSMSWSIDENAAAWQWVTGVTFQWSILAEGSLTGHPSGPHSMGMLVGDDDRITISVHHSLFAHNAGRNPRISSAARMDFRNNVVYNWQDCDAAFFTDGAEVNFVNNRYLPGPSTPACSHLLRLASGARLFMEGNWGPFCPSGCADDWDLGVAGAVSSSRAEAPFAVPSVTTSPTSILEGFVVPIVGATLPAQDAADARIVQEVLSRTGTIGIGGDYPALDPGVAPPDTDHDGMPDDWELAHGLDPNDPADGNGDLDGDGYTNLEAYLNDIGPGVFGCGDGLLQPGEECDDRNHVDGDGCDADCSLTRCGNGIVTAGEACDDGNTDPGDGCGATCQVEGCWSCAGAPSTCTQDEDCVRCQRTVTLEAAKLAQTTAKLLARCELTKLKGNHDGVCPDAEAAPGSPARAAWDKIARAAVRLESRIAKRCGGNDRTCGGDLAGEYRPTALGWPAVCPGFEGVAEAGCTAGLDDCGDLAACVECIHRSALVQAMQLYFGSLTAGGGTAVAKCQETIGRQAQRLIGKASKELQRCWDARLSGVHRDLCPDGASVPGSPARRSAERIARNESRARATICSRCGGADRACGGAEDLAPAAIGFVAECPDVTPPGGPSCARSVETLEDLVDCVACVTAFKIGCMDAAQVPEFVAYPAACNP
jgi:pectate lyase